MIKIHYLNLGFWFGYLNNYLHEHDLNQSIQSPT